jgi:hypothetical protein
LALRRRSTRLQRFGGSAFGFHSIRPAGAVVLRNGGPSSRWDPVSRAAREGLPEARRRRWGPPARRHAATSAGPVGREASTGPTPAGDACAGCFVPPPGRWRSPDRSRRGRCPGLAEADVVRTSDGRRHAFRFSASGSGWLRPPAPSDAFM